MLASYPTRDDGASHGLTARREGFGGDLYQCAGWYGIVFLGMWFENLSETPRQSYDATCSEHNCVREDVMPCRAMLCWLPSAGSPSLFLVVLVVGEILSARSPGVLTEHKSGQLP